MLRPGNVIGLVVGALIGYLCSFDIDTSLGPAKVPFYVGVGAVFGWMVGLSFYPRQPAEPRPAGRDDGLAAALGRAAAAEAEVERLRARVTELERGG
jgi:hypothetical protein